MHNSTEFFVWLIGSLISYVILSQDYNTAFACLFLDLHLVYVPHDHPGIKTQFRKLIKCKTKKKEIIQIRSSMTCMYMYKIFFYILTVSAMNGEIMPPTRAQRELDPIPAFRIAVGKISAEMT